LLSLFVVKIDHTEHIIDCFLDLGSLIRFLFKSFVRLFEEKFELFFDPGNHLVRFEKDSTLAQDQSDEGIAFAAHILVRQKLVNCFETSL